MSLKDAKRIYDIAIRLQLYIEGVKANQGLEFGQVMAEVNFEFKKLLNSVKYQTLDGLTKAELNRLVFSLRQSQSKIYSAYLEKVLKQLEDFLQAALSVTRIAYASGFIGLGDESEPEEVLSDLKASNLIFEENESNSLIALYGIAAITLGNSSLWGKILNEPIPANGALVGPFLSSFSASSQLAFENLIRKGYSNNWSPFQTIAESEKQASKILNQSEAVLFTSIQHIASSVSAAVASAIYPRYRWVSVIDNATTEICLSRNNKVYRYGKGPVPPAHIRCRSGIIPYIAAQDNETFYSWIKRQPERTQNFALSKKVADLLRSGKISSKDLLRLANPSPITIAQFKKAGIEIVTGKQP